MTSQLPSTSYRTALITGASSGMGRGLAAHFARLGVKVYAAARRAELLEQLRTEVGENIVPLTLDVADADATCARVQAIDAECGGLDLVVANAGAGRETSGRRIKWPDVRRLIDINVTGAIATLCGALPGMVERKRGHIAAVGSLAARLPLPRNSTYCATKAFLSMWLDSVRLDLKGTGVAVTLIEPAFVKSELSEKNPFPMPFLLETEDAVRRIASGLLARDQICAFPWQYQAAIGFGRSLPRPLRLNLLRRLR